MLTAALNQKGPINRESFSLVFTQHFNDFKTVRIVPQEDLPEGPLQMCQPDKDEDLLKDIEIYLDSTKTFIELRGTKMQLQKAVRNMFFLGIENKKVLFLGNDGISDFPWAIQIVIVKLPVSGWEPDKTWVRKADVIIVDGSAEKENQDFAAQIKMINPVLPIFNENIQAGLSKGLKDYLAVLFTAYNEKIRCIKEMLAEQHPDRHISCAQAHKIAGKLGVSAPLVGNACDQYGYRITHCSLGCF
ncbi:MAG: hypothetical protein AAGU27_23685 [Dehalobacterium sp.]